MALMCKSRYPVHSESGVATNTRKMEDQAFSVPKCVRLARMSEKPYELPCYIFAAVSEISDDELEPIPGKKFVGYAIGTFSNFERQN